MDNYQPLLNPRLQPIPESPNSSTVTIPHSISSTSFFHHEHDQDEVQDETDQDLCFTNPPRRPFRRTRTAPPDMAIINELIIPETLKTTKTPSPILKPITITTISILLLIMYLTIGVTFYYFNKEHYSGVKTHPLVDALYFCIVTMCTIGYGDIAPLTPLTKIFAMVFVFFGFVVLFVLFNGLVNHVLDIQERWLLGMRKEYLIDFQKGRIKLSVRFGLALGVVVLCIGIGALVLYFVEGVGFVDSVYFSVMSVMTVGNGDGAFKTVQGRLFAAVWLLVSTLAMIRAFLYFAELRVERRNRINVKMVLDRDITVQDLFAADAYQNGYMSKSEYIVLKLKEMGKVRDIDIQQIANQFDKFDPNNLGKITLPDLLGSPL